MTPDRPTRARTRPGRLSLLDGWLLRDERALLERADGPSPDAGLLDVGFGDAPDTTLELAAAVHAVNPSLCVVGVERDAARASAAEARAIPRVRFVHGGFDALPALGPARLVRAMNVLRAYAEDEVAAAHEALGAPLLEGGLVLEGSADTAGAVAVAHALRRQGGHLHREALVFLTDFSRGFSPWLFRDWLPRDFRRRVRPGEVMNDLLARWTEAWEDARDSGATAPPAAFLAAGERLAGRLRGVTVRADEAGGVLRWAPATGVPEGHSTQRCG